MSITYEEYTGSDREKDATVLCDLCSDAFHDEGLPLDDDDGYGDVLAEVASFGGDIADHLCEKREVGPEVRCDCACNQ